MFQLVGTSSEFQLPQHLLHLSSLKVGNVWRLLILQGAHETFLGRGLFDGLHCGHLNPFEIHSFQMVLPDFDQSNLEIDGIADVHQIDQMNLVRVDCAFVLVVASEFASGQEQMLAHDIGHEMWYEEPFVNVNDE